MKQLLLKSLSLINKLTCSAVVITALLFFLSCNNKFLRKSATPDENLSYSEKLTYMVETGQQDRRSNLLRYFIFTNGKKIALVCKRDSARCAYFLNMEKQLIPQTGEDKWCAGLLLFHNNGIQTCKDTVLLIKSMYYFNDLRENGPRIGDKKNGEIWYPLVLKDYNFLHEECKKYKKKS